MTAFVLVHGGFTDGEYWQDIAGGLEKEGHQVDVVAQLPSAGHDAASLGDLAADVDLVRRHVEAAGEPVVLVGHSYAGAVITELADHPGVGHAVYLAAFWPVRGQSVMDLFTAGPPATWAVPGEDGVTMRVADDLEQVRQALCADVDLATAEPRLRRLKPQSLASVLAPLTAPDRTHSVTYVITTRDGALPPPAQEQWAAAADVVERLDSAHIPQFSMPAELTATLARAAGHIGS